MAKGLLIINGYKLLPSVEYCKDRLVEEFAHQNVQIDVFKSTEIIPWINGTLLDSKIHGYDFCVFLDKDPYISHMLEMQGIKLFNSAQSIEICDDKMKTYLALNSTNIPLPKTVPGPLNYMAVQDTSFLDNLESSISYPIVVKENFGSQGSKVYIANNRKELESIESKITGEPRLFQECIKSSWGFDFRLIVIGGKLVAAMKRMSLNGDFRSNINLGGTAEIVDIPNSYKEMAEKAANILGLDYCGVDLLKGENGEPILCEVNSNAFFKKAEEVTKVNIAKAYVDHILQSLK